ncbi:hypothetical protein [Magnetovibrio sp.]|uniref:hypothetical protein n=1 Tax=Magnetovibrio sp. TaxID=2024836 RepID=UPI002F92452A
MKLTKDMALTQKMFLDTLPRALDNDAFTWDGKCAVLDQDGRRFTITFEEQANFALGGFRIPRAHVTLELSGYDDDAAEAAVTRFERYFHRGGG